LRNVTILFYQRNDDDYNGYICLHKNKNNSGMIHPTAEQQQINNKKHK